MMTLYRTIKGRTGTYKRRRERSLGPVEVGTIPRDSSMVSRRKILSRSRDDLNLDQKTYMQQEEEEDIWYQKDKLFKEHIQEVLDKWTQIDDEIWAKVIVFERNRRVAKAYARAPVLTVSGSDDGFDGMRIGLCGFDNPMRDSKTEEMKRHIGQGVKIKMDDAGNILVRRYSKSNVYVKSTASSPNEETAIGAEVLKAPNQCLDVDKVMKVFDMKKFQSNVNRELSRAYPDRRRLETQCLSLIGFVKAENDLLDCPIWIMIVNVVAMDMLKSKLPPVLQRPVDIKNRPRIPIPDEDPYSIAGSGEANSGSSGYGVSGSFGEERGRERDRERGTVVAATREQLIMQSQQFGLKRSEKPPKLPPRDNMYPHDLPMADYDNIDDENCIKLLSRIGKSDKGKNKEKYDDPYYSGMRARVPNFVSKVNSKSNKLVDKNSIYSSKNNLNKSLKQKDQIQSKQRVSVAAMAQTALVAPLSQFHQMHNNTTNLYTHHLPHQQQHQQFMWHSRSYESGIDSEESPYQIYGRMPLPTRGYVPTPRGLYVGEWD
ncbi:unnamed protein product [Diamesa tonsa]